MRIILSKKHKDILTSHAKKCAPSESCALLFGRMNPDSCTVSDVFLAENVDDSPVNFTISNEELLKGYDLAEQKKLDVVGIFHSHPSSDAIPSSTDEKFMEMNPVVWVIFSNRDDTMRAYLLDSILDLNEVAVIIK